MYSRPEVRRRFGRPVGLWGLEFLLLCFGCAVLCGVFFFSVLVVIFFFLSGTRSGGAVVLVGFVVWGAQHGYAAPPPGS